MSYALTDAVEEDLRDELSRLDDLIEEIDQLAAEARDCDTVAPKVKRALDLAWWLAEEAYRDAHSAGTCGHADFASKKADGKWCQNCHHFGELRTWALSVRRYL